MRIVAIVLLVLVPVFSAMCAELYTKVDDQTIGITVQKETSEQYTLDQLDHELAGIEKDLSNIEAMKTPILERKAKLEAAKAQAEILGVKKPEPVAEPVIDYGKPPVIPE